ncbi:MAG: DUF3817 domain-containing protein [Thermoleophilia bacterium]|jgi:integral membrane protein|nr:DUF3817 domain-containing protein [Thermoleophilia bacterium]
MPARAVTLFRVAAFAEALSWAGLLVGMLFKYALGGSEIGVQVFGPIHGVVFIGYMAAALYAWTTLGWRQWVGVTALAAGIPPFTSVAFEWWARRRGLLDPSRPDGVDGSALPV